MGYMANVISQDDDKAISQMGIGEGVPRADTEEELRQKREDEQQGLRDKMAELTGQMETLELGMKKLGAGIQQVREWKILGFEWWCIIVRPILVEKTSTVLYIWSKISFSETKITEYLWRGNKCILND